MSDKKCSKKMSKAFRKERLCTSARDEKLICDVRKKAVKSLKHNKTQIVLVF